MQQGANKIKSVFDRGLIIDQPGGDFSVETLPDKRQRLRLRNLPSVQKAVGASGCWATGFLPEFAAGFNYGLLWPERILPPSHRSFPSDITGWWWHDMCARTFYYKRDVATGALSSRQCYQFFGYLQDNFDFGGPEIFSTPGYASPVANWYNPSAADVTGMLSYVSAIACSAGPTATMEVAFIARMWRERHWASVDGGGHGLGPFWTYRLDEATGTWPQITEFAWRYI